MAITKIWTVKDDLNRVLSYIKNSDKTKEEMSDGLKERKRLPQFSTTELVRICYMFCYMFCCNLQQIPFSKVQKKPQNMGLFLISKLNKLTLGELWSATSTL